MMGYLQRLLDAALPASGAGPLTPVVKSTSPIFEQNQLLGLADLHAGEGDAEVAPAVADVRSAQTPFPPAAPAATLEITGRNPQPVTPALWPEATLGRPMSVAPLPPRPAAATAPALPELPDAVIGPAQPDPETLEPAPRLEAEPLAPREPAWEVTPAPAPLEPVLPLAETGRVATEAAPAILPEARSQLETEARPATLHTVVRDVPRDLEAIERAADAPLPPRDVEPRPRPDFEDGDPEPHQPRPEPLQAPPSITIGRVTVELVPDPAPAAKPARAPRTAATASMIGLLGNRRARRRLFALSRL